jgi:3-phosphoshikimate 1-carboxyvinyltransferase
MASLTRERVVRVPGDKSIAHRALMLAALADGPSRLRAVPCSADVRATARVLAALGVDIPIDQADVIVEGRGLGGLRRPSVDLDCGNSGTTARLMAGIVAGHAFRSRFVGDASLSRRPMGRVARPLQEMGATVEVASGGGLPMIVRGAPLRAVSWTSPNASAQVKSAVLLAATVGGVAATVAEPAPSRDHTERMLRSMGAKVVAEDNRVTVEPTPRLCPLDSTIPGDPSSVAYFVAYAVLSRSTRVVCPDVCLNDRRTGFFRVLHAMGAEVTWDVDRIVGGEEVGTITASASRVSGMAIPESEVSSTIDELPLLACVAAHAEGETVISGAAELRVKESDRLAAVIENLRVLGAQVEPTADGLRIRGSERPLRGAVRTHGDHRLAMAFGVLGALPGNEIAIDDAGCVDVSYPAFWSDLERTAA